MKRRDFMKAAVTTGMLGGSGCLEAARNAEATRDAIATPLPRQAAWQDFELGIVYHFDLDVYMPGGHHHERSRREKLDPNLYQPRKLDTDQWIEAASAMGARYAIFTATHHQGFLQWQSDAYPFGLRQIKWRDGKGDIVEDFVKSCHKYGISPGIYIGIRFNAYRQVYNYKLNGGKGGPPEERNRYMRVCEKMVEELCSRYGELCEIWFDGGVITPGEGGPDVLPIVEKLQPNAVFYHSIERAEHRWAGNEAGTVGYPCWSMMPTVASQLRAHKGQKQRMTLLRHGDPEGKVWCPAMCDAPIREHDWLWIPNREDRLQPLDKLVNMYYKSVGHNANLILGAVPDTDGLIPQADFERYAEFGKEIRRRFGSPIAQTEGRGTSLELAIPSPGRIDHVSIMEDIAQGERIRKYAVEALVPGDKWEQICEGVSVGHKRIQQFKPVETVKIRLRVLESVARPVVRNLAVYCTSRG